MEYALNVKGHRGAAARTEAERVLDAVGLSDRLGFLPRDLSGGQKQRIAIARALAGKSPILLADEPTANLDSHIGGQVLEMFRALAKKEDRALLIVTHDPKVRSIADRVLRIRDGELAQRRNRRLRRNVMKTGFWNRALWPLLGLGILAVVGLQARAAVLARGSRPGPKRPRRPPRRPRRPSRPRGGW